jgi:hypothetical protein
VIKGYEKLFLGKAGEFRVMSELLLRGFEPAISSVDIGTDIILSNGIKIQVKTSSVIFNAIGSRQINPTKYFTFNLCRGQLKNIDEINKFCDFFICWVVLTNDFYIIPVGELIKSNVCIPIDRDNPWEKYKNNWELLRRITNG